MLITHGESGRTRNVVAPTSLAGQFEQPYGPMGSPILSTIPVLRYMKTHGRPLAEPSRSRSRSDRLAAPTAYLSLVGSMTRSPVPSSAYKLFEQAMTSRKQILCTYGGYDRELCPFILGHTNGQEVALAYQFGGQSKSGLPPQGQWKCLSLSKASNIQLRDGPWHAGSSHTRHQACVQAVDLDVNPASPYSPKRPFTPLP